MKLLVNKILTKVRNVRNSDIVQFLNKKSLSVTWLKFTDVKKPQNKIPKPNLFMLEKKDSIFYSKNRISYNKDNISYNSAEEIHFSAYFLLGIPICAFVLGTWQVQRLKWKLDLIKKLNSRIHQEAIELPEDLQDLESKEYYPIKVKGTFLHDKEFMAGYRSLIVDGKPIDRPLFGLHKDARGYQIITPFKLADRDLTILVNRGWIPKTLKNPRTRQEGQIEEETEIVGILRLNERRPSFVPKNRPHRNMWYYRDVNGMSEKADTSPIYLEIVVDDNSPKYPVGSQTIVELRNEHFSYILTWYSLSLITTYLWYRKFVKGIPLTA